MQPTLPSQSRVIEPGAVARGLDSVVGPFVAEEHTGFALRRAGGDKADGGPKILLGLPEVREMVSGRSQRTVEAKRDPGTTSCRAMEAVLMEESHQPLLLRTDPLWSILQASERPDHSLRLRYEAPAPLAASQVGFDSIPLVRSTLYIQEYQYHRCHLASTSIT